MDISYQILMDGISEMFFVLKVDNSRNFRYEFINKTAMKRLGLNQNIIGLTIEEVFPKEKACYFIKQYRKVVEHGKKIVYEDSYREEGYLNKKYYSETTLNPLFDENGKCNRIVALVRDITKERAALFYIKDMVKKLMESNERYQSLFSHNPDGILTLDKRGFITNGNLAIESITGYNVIDLVGKSFKDIMNNNSKLSIDEIYKEAIMGNQQNRDLVLVNKQGKLINISLKVIPLIIDQEVLGLFATFKDITKQLQNIEKLEESEKRFRIIAENAHDLITLINNEGKIIYVSPSYRSILGYNHKEYIGNFFYHNVHENDVKELTKKFKDSIDRGIPIKTEFRQYNNEGDWIWCESISKPVFNQKKEFQHLVVLTRDITLRKEYEDKLRYFAYHDSLTGLPNRLFFNKKFNIAKEKFLQNKDGLALIILDIDYFKLINDNYGHDIGDSVIKEFSNRIKQSVREIDTVARLGGDEFIVLLPEIQSSENVFKIAESIKKNIGNPWNINDEELRITTSMGITMASLSKDFSNTTLMKQADIALYSVKEGGRNAYKLFQEIEEETQSIL
jgi:diguanylate cyclase (GGDEF)-like protein/PAS domain S-box-containing protein